MKLISWNVNGIRACINKGFLDFLEFEKPDVIGLQEIKGKPDQIDSKHLEKIESLGYKMFWNPALRPGYSGTAIFSKIEPNNFYKGINLNGINIDELSIDDVIKEDTEGRVSTLEFNDFYFVTVYTPNSKSELERLSYRKIWDNVFLEYLKELEKNKPVICCGDLNVAHKEIDLKNPKPNMTTNTRPGSAGFTNQERESFSKFINSGFLDTFRFFYPEKLDMYTWWSYFGKARDRNVGWRIDYFLASSLCKDILEDSFIIMEQKGSDHCPVGLKLKNT